MKTCVYDNPATFRRETWQDGKLCSWILADLLYDRHFAERYPKIPTFEPGKIHKGSLEAMQEVNQ